LVDKQYLTTLFDHPLTPHSTIYAEALTSISKNAEGLPSASKKLVILIHKIVIIHINTGNGHQPIHHTNGAQHRKLKCAWRLQASWL